MYAMYANVFKYKYLFKYEKGGEMKLSTSTSIRVSEETIIAMRLAASELALTTRQWLQSDDQRIQALVEYWQRTKESAEAEKEEKVGA
jgi:hypothetical protein